MNTSQKAVELEEMPIILKIPKDTAQLTLTTTILNEDGEVTHITRKLSPSEVYDCYHDYLRELDEALTLDQGIIDSIEYATSFTEFNELYGD